MFPFVFVAVSLFVCTYGISIGWLTPVMDTLQTKDSPLPSEPLTIDEVSWIAGNDSIGGLIGNLFFGYLMDVIGRKKSLIFMILPAIVWNNNFPSIFIKTKHIHWSIKNGGFFFLGKLAIYAFCTKCELFVCSAYIVWILRWWYLRCNTHISGGDRRWQVNITVKLYKLLKTIFLCWWSLNVPENKKKTGSFCNAVKNSHNFK